MEPIRFEPRPPFGIRRGGRTLLILLAIGIAALAPGLAWHVVPLVGLGACVLMFVPMLALAMASAKAQAHVFIVREDALVVERSRGGTIEIPRESLQVIQVVGQRVINVKAATGTFSFGTMAHSPEAIARLVALLT